MTEKVFYQDAYQKTLQSTVVEVVEGGLMIPNDDGSDCTLMAHAGAIVWLDVPEALINER